MKTPTIVVVRQAGPGSGLLVLCDRPCEVHFADENGEIYMETTSMDLVQYAALGVAKLLDQKPVKVDGGKTNGKGNTQFGQNDGHGKHDGERWR